jgi:predicted transcriptional regulator
MRGFGELETVIMARVWAQGHPVTVRELFDELAGERAIAYTTVMTTMDNLHRKGWLTRVKEGKAYRYTATASREEYSARLMREALDGGGDTQAVLSHFVAQMDGAESELLRAVVRKLAERLPEAVAGPGLEPGREQERGREAGAGREPEPGREAAAGREAGAG